MKNLELECSECSEKITLEVTGEEYEHYQATKSLPEGSEAYRELFDGRGWVLQQATFCKYEHSEVYREDY